MEMAFRNAAFGGFHRQDVMDYIAATAKETGDRITALEEELGELQDAAGENARLRELVAQLEEREQELQRTIDTLTARQEQLQEHSEDRDRLAGENRQMAQKVQEYSSLKQHIADIELDAHKRADAVVAEAEEQAKEIIRRAQERQQEIRQNTAQELQLVEESYRELLHVYEVVSTHVTGELRKIDVTLNQMPTAFQRMTSALENMKKL